MPAGGTSASAFSIRPAAGLRTTARERGIGTSCRAAAASRISRQRSSPAFGEWRRMEGRDVGRQSDAGDCRNGNATGVDPAETEDGPGQDPAENEDSGALTKRGAGRSSSCTGGRNTANSSTCCDRSRPCSAPRRCSARAPLCSVSSARSAWTPARHLGADHEHHAGHHRREDHGVGDGEHRRRVDDDPVERPVREVGEKCFMRSDASSSDGFGGVRPAVIANRFGSAVRWMTSRTRAWPTSSCDRPRRSSGAASGAGPGGACRRR